MTAENRSLPTTAATKGAPDPRSRRWGLVAVVAVLLLTAAVRLRTLHFPLERDEGEYAYAGQLILQGIPPYELACNMKFPGTYAAYALIMWPFGQTPAAIHLGLILVTTATSLLIYGLGRRIGGEMTGVVAATTCAFLSASPAVRGLAAHATQFAALFATAGVVILWSARRTLRTGHVLAAGFLFGMAVLMKQQAAVFCIWGVAVLAAPGVRRTGDAWSRRLIRPVLLAVGAAVPLSITCAILWRAGVFERFWFWTVTYARAYVSEVPLAAAPHMLRVGVSYVLGSNALLWILGAAGGVLIGFHRGFREARGFLAGFSIASFLTTCPGLYFRSHYFLLMVPAVSLLAGCAVTAVTEISSRRLTLPWRGVWPAAAYTLILVAGAVLNREVWWLLPPAQAVRVLYGMNPFPEAEVVSDYIRTHSAPDDTVAVLGSEPEIYFLSHRHSATSQIYTYALMEPQPYAATMQADMIREIESAKPEYVVFARVRASWLPRRTSDLRVMTWWEQSYRSGYTLVGVAEVASLTETRYTWGASATAPADLGVNVLLVYRRDRDARG